MPRNETTGIFTRVSNSFSQPVAGTVIDNTDADELFDDYDAGLTGAMAWYQPLRIVTEAGPITVSDTEAGVAVNKTVGEATAISIPDAAVRNDNGALPITIKDLKGDAGTNNITITPDAGTIQGFSDWTLGQDFEIVTFVPLADGSGYYVG